MNSIGNDTTLHIIGPGEPEVIKEIETLAGSMIGDKIRLYGRLPNVEAVKIIEEMDIIALPTYYPSEAFPISILEAMSRGKMVISCDTGAIKDMLTSEKGGACGLIVEKQNPTDIIKAILWCQSHSSEADSMCKLAYEKVYNVYRTEVVLNQYYSCYKQLLKYD